MSEASTGSTEDDPKDDQAQASGAEAQDRFNYFRECYQRGTFADLKIHADSGIVCCHRIILAAAFPKFRTLLLVHNDVEAVTELFLPDFDYSTLKDLVSSLYQESPSPSSLAVPLSLQCWLGKEPFQQLQLQPEPDLQLQPHHQLEHRSQLPPFVSNLEVKEEALEDYGSYHDQVSMEEEEDEVENEEEDESDEDFQPLNRYYAKKKKKLKLPSGKKPSNIGASKHSTFAKKVQEVMLFMFCLFVFPTSPFTILEP